MEVIGKASLAMGAMAADTVDLFGKKKVVVVTSTRGCPRLTSRVARRCAVLRHVAQAQRRTPAAETMSPASPAPEETPRPVRFGIVGCANIARKLSRAMLLVPSAAEVAAVGSRSEGKARRFAADNGLPAGTRLHGSYEALLDDPDVDAVYLPLPTSLHLKWATAAAARGKHVLLEKPTALCAADLDAILAACEASGVQFMDCTMWVHNPRTAKMRELVADQATIGDVRVINTMISFQVNEDFLRNDIRVKPGLDALGALGDIGWYCIRAILWAVDYELPNNVIALRNPVKNQAGVLLACGRRGAVRPGMMEACCRSSSSSVPSASILATGAGLRRRFSPAAAGVRALALALAHPLRASAALLAAAAEPPRRGQQRRGTSGVVVRAVFERFTERAVKAVVFSQREARGMGDESVAPHHLLLGLVAEDRSAAGFLASGVRVERAREVCRAAVGKGGPAQAATGLATDVPFSSASKRVFEAAVEFSRNMGCNFISPEHIALGLFNLDDPTTNSILKSLGVDPSQLAKQALTRVQGELAKDGREPVGLSSFKVREKSTPGSGKTAIVKYSNKKKEKKSALAQFCVDLTMRASGGLIDPVIGRKREIERVVQIICRRTKNNPILLGEAGVGKTAIAEGLALKIANGDVPIFLVAKRILSLDVALLMAGAKERGELEARVTSLVREVRKAGDVILFIDEVHNLIGSGIAGRGSKGAGLDIANLLKPALARGELQCIASTTLDEHRLHFEKDKALARRFQPVSVNEPSQEDAVKILLGLREKYETYHKCKYTLEGINAAVYLSARYIPDRHLPDKAIDLIDEAGSRARMESFKRKKEEQCSILLKSPDEYWQEIRAVQAMHEVALTNRLKYSLNENDQENDVNVEVLNEGKTSPTSTLSASADEPSLVGSEEIARVTSLWSGIPVQQLTADERKLLVGLDDELRKRVIGQDDAVVAISRAVKRSRVGLNDPDRPTATLLFCGPTGVGKTELTKALAASYFGSESAMVRLDMSEYMERHTVSKLIGSPPGYMGFGEGGTLTEAVRRKPFNVVLLDEIEKAHPDIFNLLLQVFEDGHLTNSQGRRVSFKNTLIVMTSNVGSSSISNGRKSIGFMTQNDTVESTYAVMKSLVMEELKAFFRPELLNRMDDVVVFRPLEKTQMLAILNIILQEVKGRLLALGIGLEVSDAMKNLISQQGYDRSYGARPLRRAVTQLVEDVISEAILSGQYKPGDTIMMDTDATGKPRLSRLNDQTVQLSDPTPTV